MNSKGKTLKSILWSTVVFVSIYLILLSPARADKRGSPTQIMVDSLKAIGEPYPGDLWHALEAEYRMRLQETGDALEPPGFRLDGGTDSSNATIINSNPYFDSGNTSGKGNNASIPSCLSGGNDTAEDAWYVVTFDTTVLLTVWTTCESSGPPSYDTRLGIFDNNLVLLACNDDAPDCGGPYYQSRITDEPLGAGTYFVVVDGYNGASGPYELNASWTIQEPPCSGSNQSNAIVIFTLPYTDQGTTVGACDDVMIVCELSGPNTAPDYWYQITLDTTMMMDVWTTCDPVWFDSKLAILDENLNQMYCNDDAPGCSSYQSFIQDAALYPGIYYIIVDGWRTSEGAYELNVDGVPFDAGDIVDRLPDIIVRESDLYDNDIVTDIEPGRTHLRLANGTANIGSGKLYVYGLFPPDSDSTQQVNQRIFRSDGSFWDRAAGVFVFHPGHSHIHFENWCSYRLREVLDGGGVGPLVAEGTKTSFCLLDLAIYDNNLPYFDPDGQFHSCSSTIQGISVGWIDIYGKSLPGQNIDITDVPDGVYWLESLADPADGVLEEDETNNATRILVVIGSPDQINPDPYEPNETTSMVDSRPAGGPNSPNLGPCGPERIIAGLNVHESGNEDFFKFYSNHNGGSNDFVQIEFQHSLGDLDLRLLNENGEQVGQSNGVGDVEIISMESRPEGWYYIRVFGFDGAVNPYYTLTVNPPQNQTPSVTTTHPPEGNIFIIHGAQTFNVEWTYSDPESDLCWVTVYLNHLPQFDGNEYLMSSSLYTDADLGFYVVNTAYLEEDIYWAYCEITDGGSISGDWSEGTVTIIGDELAGSIVGYVIDEISNPIEDVYVMALKTSIEDSTDAAGAYSLDNLAPGIYNIGFSHIDFRDTTIYGVAVDMGDTTILNIQMFQETNIPTLSEWGMIILALLLISMGTVAVVMRRRVALGRSD